MLFIRTFPEHFIPSSYCARSRRNQRSKADRPCPGEADRETTGSQETARQLHRGYSTEIQGSGRWVLEPLII